MIRDNKELIEIKVIKMKKQKKLQRNLLLKEVQKELNKTLIIQIKKKRQ